MNRTNETTADAGEGRNTFQAFVLSGVTTGMFFVVLALSHAAGLSTPDSAALATLALSLVLLADAATRSDTDTENA